MRTPVLRYAEEPGRTRGNPALRSTSEPASGLIIGKKQISNMDGQDEQAKNRSAADVFILSILCIHVQSFFRDDPPANEVRSERGAIGLRNTATAGALGAVNAVGAVWAGSGGCGSGGIYS
jgi:hypothetical protein